MIAGTDFFYGCSTTVSVKDKTDNKYGISFVNNFFKMLANCCGICGIKHFRMCCYGKATGKASHPVIDYFPIPLCAEVFYYLLNMSFGSIVDKHNSR